MTELEQDWDEFDPETERAKEMLAAEERAQNEPNFDYFKEHRPRLPKAEIGQYVADQGFKVPLITDQADWERAFDEGVAMIRSEMPQDYDGLSGLFDSAVIDKLEREEVSALGQELGELIMKSLRNGELDPRDYMMQMRGKGVGWMFGLNNRLSEAYDFGRRLQVSLHELDASRWRYVPGTNVSVFADPHVEGRYYFGVKLPRQHEHGRQPVGGFQFDVGEYDTPKRYRKHDQPFVPGQLIEFYEQIRNLTRFDNTQCPVLELQQDMEGNIHFLQYLKTGQEQQLVEPFDLPESADMVRTTNVRGITPPEGKEMRLYITPNKMAKGMEGEGVYCSVARPRRFHVLISAMLAGFILHDAYISFEDNHFDSSPLFRPPLAAGLVGSTENSLAFLRHVHNIIEGVNREHYHDREAVKYVDIKVTSNGREAVIESDWNPQTVGYDDIGKGKV